MTAPSPDTHRTLVRDAFDAVAPSFDSRLENDITRRLRALLDEVLTSVLPPGSSVLDISCGTGIDVLRLHGLGFDASGCDLSPRMIEACRAKAPGGRPTFRVLAMEDLPGPFQRPFDAVLSNFGALNCVTDLSSVARSVASTVRPGGVFVAVIMPPFSLWETVAGLARARWSLAFRRWQGRTHATGLGADPFIVAYHPIRSVRRVFSPYFRCIRTEAWNLLSPPPHATAFVAKAPRLTRSLVAADGVLGRLPLFRAWGDHTLFVFRRTDALA